VNLVYNHLAILTVSTIDRLSCHDAKWREHVESKASNTDAFPANVMMFFFNLGPRALEMLQARTTLIRQGCLIYFLPRGQI